MSTAVRPYPFAAAPRLTDAEVQLVERLARDVPSGGELLDCLERLLGAPLEPGVASLGAAEPARAAGSLTVGWLARLEDAGREVAGFFHVDAPLVMALAARLLSGRAGAAEVRPLLAVEEEAVAALLGVVLAEAGLPLRPQTARPRELERLGAVAVGRFVQYARLDGVGGFVTLWMAPERWPARPQATHRAQWPARLAHSPLRDGFRVDLHVRLATFRDTYRALLELGVGDVLLPRAWHGLSRPTAGRLYLAAQPVAEVAVEWTDGIEIRLLGRRDDQEGRVSDSDASTRRTLKQMRPVLDERMEELELVVGGVQLTLGEILELEPGRVFALNAPLEAPVELVLDGRTIGRGELVEVGGRLGVRITAIAR